MDLAKNTIVQHNRSAHSCGEDAKHQLPEFIPLIHSVYVTFAWCFLPDPETFQIFPGSILSGTYASSFKSVAATKPELALAAPLTNMEVPETMSS